MGAEPIGSMWAVDDRGTGLRVTWRLAHGFINLSIWRADVCVETFHLAPADAARFVSFLVDGLAGLAARPALAVVPDEPPPPTPAPAPRWRRRLAGELRRAADRLAP